MASSFRCGEDREAGQRHACNHTDLPPGHQRMVQKNFFSRKGFSEAGTGIMSGSSRMWASQYAIRSAAALDTWNIETKEKINVSRCFSDFYILLHKGPKLCLYSGSYIENIALMFQEHFRFLTLLLQHLCSPSIWTLHLIGQLVQAWAGTALHVSA